MATIDSDIEAIWAAPGALSASEVAVRLHAALPSTPIAGVLSGQVYAWANEFARHVINLVADGDVREVGAVFDTVEDLFHAPLSAEGRSFLVMGVLDSLQSMTTHPAARVHSADFVDLLGPLTRERWDRLHAVWGSSDEVDF